jgi:hypothetical protein
MNNDAEKTWEEKTYGPLGKTTDKILSHVGSAQLSTVLGALRYRIWQKVELRGESCLTSTERRLLVLNAFVAAVFNGGFEQYFYRSTGDSYPSQALEGLRAIEATVSAELLARAMSVFPGGIPPADANSREILIDQIKEEAEPIWSHCDDELYEAWEHESISDLTLSFILKHREEIVLCDDAA